MNQLEIGAAWLESQRIASASTPMVYQRTNGSGGFNMIPVNATVGETTEIYDDVENYGLRVRTRDYLIAAAELQISNAPIVPMRGDQIVEPDGTIYEVAPLKPGPEWRWHDRLRMVYRIHTKQVAG